MIEVGQKNVEYNKKSSNLPSRIQKMLCFFNVSFKFPMISESINNFGPLLKYFCLKFTTTIPTGPKMTHSRLSHIKSNSILSDFSSQSKQIMFNSPQIFLPLWKFIKIIKSMPKICLDQVFTP